MGPFSLLLRLVFAACLLSMVRDAAQRLARTRAARERLRPDVIPAAPATSDECAERLEVYDAWAWRDFTITVATSVTLLLTPEAVLHGLGWPATVVSPVGAAGIVALLNISAFLVRSPRYLRRLGFDCPRGGHSLLWRRVAAGWEIEPRRNTLRLTGRCHTCAAQVFVPDE